MGGQKLMFLKAVSNNAPIRGKVVHNYNSTLNVIG